MRERPSWRAGLWLRRHRIRGKQGFIWTIVVARLALPAAVLVTLTRAWMSPQVRQHVWGHLAAGAVAALLGGYVGGVVLWELVVNRGGRTARRRPPPVPEPREPQEPPPDEPRRRSRELPPPRM